MMNEYTFLETSSRTENDAEGNPIRRVNFRGNDPEGQINVDGYVHMPVMDYFMAGVDGSLPQIIKDKVIERLSEREEQPEA